MRRNLLVTATISGLWLAGCSRPASGPAVSDQPVGGRDLQMVEAPTPIIPASDLEVGRRPTPGVSNPAPARHANHIAESTPEVTVPTGALAAIALDRAPVLSATAVPTATDAAVPVQQTLVQAPRAVEMFPAGGLRPAAGPFDAGTGQQGTYPGRGPTIIIRGGRGGIDDDCDLDRPGIHGHGAAVNRTAPAFGGGVIGGQAPRIGGRFPRGIR